MGTGTTSETRFAMSLLWPLRLFMGVTFLYAGIQHLTDPSYFDSSKLGYIGHLISQYAVGSPIHAFLMGVVEPNAVSFGYAVAVGETLIGIATLLGLFFKIAAFAGLLLNFTFFLSATWNVFPFYFGSDIVFMMCWLTLLLTGPQIGQSMDGALAKNHHLLSWLVNRPNHQMIEEPDRAAPLNTKTEEVRISIGTELYPKQVFEVNKAFDRIKQQFVSHRETQTVLELVRAFIISLGVDRNDTPIILNGIQNVVNRSSVNTPST